MHVQIINYQLQGLSEAEHANICKELAPQFAAIPGLTSKIWLANRETGVFGGVYLWQDRKAMEEFAKSELCNAVLTHPNLTGLTSTDFAVQEAPTAVTRGLLEPA